MTRIIASAAAFPATSALTAPRPVSVPVILTSTSDYALAAEGPVQRCTEPSLGLITISEALLAAGHDPGCLALFSKPGRPQAVLERDATRIVSAMRSAGASEKSAVIGISTRTSQHYKFPPLARLLRSAFPDALLIAGGAHFVREEINGFADPIESALAAGLVDGVQQDHAQGFVDLVVRHGGRLDKTDSPGLYRRDPATGEILGSGRGAYPRVDAIPLIHDADQRSLHLMLRDGCMHRCGFCAVSSRISPPFSVEEAVSGLRRELVEGNANQIEFFDSNPLLPSRREFYRDVMGALDAIRPTAKIVYLDPSILAEELEESINTALISTFWHFFAGRDAVLESAALDIGANYRGKPKDQARLDREKLVLRTFIQVMKQAHAQLYREAPPMGLTISFIITPFETRERADAILEEMREFEAMADERMSIGFSLPPLMPFPGTEIRKRYSGAIDMEDFDFYRVFPDRIAPWKADAAPSLAFHRAMLFLARSRGPREMIAGFQRAIERYLS